MKMPNTVSSILYMLLSHSSKVIFKYEFQEQKIRGNMIFLMLPIDYQNQEYKLDFLVFLPDRPGCIEEEKNVTRHLIFKLGQKLEKANK